MRLVSTTVCASGGHTAIVAARGVSGTVVGHRGFRLVMEWIEKGIGSGTLEGVKGVGSRQTFIEPACGANGSPAMSCEHHTRLTPRLGQIETLGAMAVLRLESWECGCKEHPFVKTSHTLSDLQYPKLPRFQLGRSHDLHARLILPSSAPRPPQPSTTTLNSRMKCCSTCRSRRRCASLGRRGLMSAPFCGINIRRHSCHRPPPTTICLTSHSSIPPYMLESSVLRQLRLTAAVVAAQVPIAGMALSEDGSGGGSLHACRTRGRWCEQGRFQQVWRDEGGVDNRG